MAGLQYKFFPTDFFVPTFEPNVVVDSPPKAAVLINSNHQINGSDELPNNKDTKLIINKNKLAKFSLYSSVDSSQRSITPVTKKN